VAARLAPCLRIEADTGITPHEHNETGTPKTDAFTTDATPRPPRCRSTHLEEMPTDSIPAIRKPNKRYGAIWPSNRQLSPMIIDRVSSIVIS